MADDEPKTLPAWLQDPPPAPAPPSTPEGPDKSAWGDGPWMHEPDRAEWVHRGVLCLAVRAQLTGNWCGYVVVESGHPWHGQDAHSGAFDAVKVHWGISWSAETDDHGPAPLSTKATQWLVGFDCCHAFDYSPGLAAMCGRFAPIPPEEYRDLAYVKRECEQLAEQLIAARKQ